MRRKTQKIRHRILLVVWYRLCFYTDFFFSTFLLLSSTFFSLLLLLFYFYVRAYLSPTIHYPPVKFSPYDYPLTTIVFSSIYLHCKDDPFISFSFFLFTFKFYIWYVIKSGKPTDVGTIDSRYFYASSGVYNAV